MIEQSRAVAIDREDHAESVYRADTDHSGAWYVWRKLCSNGWATMQRCDSREMALRIADAMNRWSRRSRR